MLAFRLNLKSESNKIWLLLLVPVALTTVVVGLELLIETRFEWHLWICEIAFWRSKLLTEMCKIIPACLNFLGIVAANQFHSAPACQVPISHFRKDWRKLSQLSMNIYTQLCRKIASMHMYK